MLLLLLLVLLQVFSQLGGLQLDKDVRSLVAAAGELTTRPIRDKFARLTQVGNWLHLSSLFCHHVTHNIAPAGLITASINACLVHGVVCRCDSVIIRFSLQDGCWCCCASLRRPRQSCWAWE
jgi:hypothetical protein